jgi:hypothetical protein
MAATHPVGPLGHPIHFDESRYPFWRDHIPRNIRTQLIEEDVRAGETVVMEILAIVSSVILLGAATVLFICR